MAYKTLTLQLYRPGSRKRALMDAALLRYSQALQALLDGSREKLSALAASGDAVTQRALLGFVGKDLSKSLNLFRVQPFKDSLKMEFAGIASAYVAQKRRNPAAGYPCVYRDPEQFVPALEALNARFDAGELGRRRYEAETARLLAHTGRFHSLYFARYSDCRDYCLLYDEYKDRFYAKLYLTNRQDAFDAGELPGALSLRTVAPGLPPAPPSPGRRRFVVLPLAFGRKQYDSLRPTLQNPSLLRTARLVKKGGAYYLYVNIACGAGRAAKIASTMGVSRAWGGLHYTVCRKEEILAQGRIALSAQPSQLLHLLANRVAELAEEHASQVVLEAEGGKNDRLGIPAGSARAAEAAAGYILRLPEYKKLSDILSYKLPEKGLPAPIEVSANGLFFTCPVCGARTRRNRITTELFACVECGYASPAASVGSENLARRLSRYQTARVPLYFASKDGATLFFNRTLGFMFPLPQGADKAALYEALQTFLDGASGFERDVKKYGLLQKLRQAPRLRDAVRFVPGRP